MRNVYSKFHKFLTTLKSQAPKAKDSRKGFTLIEIMLVLGLLTLIVSIVGPKLTGALFSGQNKAVKIQIKQIESYLDRYRLDCNFYPTTEQGLKALYEKPTAGRICQNYDPVGYLPPPKKVPVDPWGTEFKYESDGLTYKITSFGRDGVEGGDGENSDVSSEEQ